MAEEKKDAFPMMPVSHWWALRSRFKNSIPGVVTASYVASALNMKEVSARTNIIPYLKQVGMIDDDGKPQNIAREWRDDQKYPDVCKHIIESTYPSELRDACPDPASDRPCVERWFANRTGSGKIAVGKMAAFYILLIEADVEKKPTGGKQESSSKRQGSASRQADKVNKASPKQKGKIDPSSSGPSIHLNLEIHISADASSDQIDKIFESMAKHIYQKKS